jgi:hypothetical protein
MDYQTEEPARPFRDAWIGSDARVLAPTHDSIGAKLRRFLFPSYSWCGRCGRPWKGIECHATPYGNGRGVFPLCERCWSSLTPVDRLPYYERLANFQHWKSGERAEVRAAVEAGL